MSTHTARKGSDDGDSLAGLAYSRLKDDIRQGRVRPGERLREIEVATALGISRTPVREALGRLQSDGLLVTGPKGGLVTAQVGPQEAVELYALRELLEGAAAEWSAKYSSEAEIELLREIVSRQAKTPAAQSEALAELNRRFHQLLYHTAHNRYLLAALNGLQDSLALLPGTTYSVPDRPQAALEEHSRILEAISSQDGDAAKEAARKHIREAQRVRLMLLLDS